MTIRGRLLRTIGVGTTWQDDPPPSDEAIVGARLLGADEVVGALSTLPPVATPWGFARLSAGVIQSATHELQLRRSRCCTPGEPPHRIALRPSTGAFHCALSTWGEAELAAGVDPTPKDHLVWLDLVAPSAPRTYGYVRSAAQAAEEAHALALADVRALGRWHVNEAGVCWEAGAPWPENLEPVHEAIPAPAIRRIMRAVRARIERGLPKPIAEDWPFLFFEPLTGECFGSNYPLTERYWGRPTDTYLVVPATDDDPEALDELERRLHRVRVVQPSGRVVVLDEVMT